MKCIYSKNEGRTIKWFECNNKNNVRNFIKEWFANNPTDIIELGKEYPKNNPKRYLGYQIVGVYVINPKTNKPSLKYSCGNKTCFRDLK